MDGEAMCRVPVSRRPRGPFVWPSACRPWTTAVVRAADGRRPLRR